MQKELDHFQLLNELRAQGFSCSDGTYFPPNNVPLIWHCPLFEASQWHSQDMADENYFSHTGQTPTTTPWQRAEARGTSANGENIAAGKEGAAAVLEQWKNSLGHCKNMGKASFKSFAVGYAYINANYRHYWTQMFSNAASGFDSESCVPESLLLMQSNETQKPKTLDFDFGDLKSAAEELKKHDESKCPISKPEERGDDQPCAQGCDKMLAMVKKMGRLDWCAKKKAKKSKKCQKCADDVCGF